MSQNTNKESRYFLLASLFGITAYLIIIILFNIPEQIRRGQQGATAIQLLDAMRRPLLAIEHSELNNALSNTPRSKEKQAFKQNIATIQTLLAQYHKTSRYNAKLMDNVDTLSILINDWVASEQAERDTPTDTKPPSLPPHLLEDRLRLLHTLTVLAEGEAPIHADIEQGQSAERLLQWGGAALLVYLFLLFILFQRFREKELLSHHQALKQAQSELQRRENYLSLTLNSIGDAVIATDAKGNIIRMNPVAENLTGWRQDDAQNRPLPEVFNIINAHTRKAVDNPVEKVLASGQIVGLANHTVLIARDGSEYQIADSGAPITDASGKILGVILVFRDVTQEYQQQEALRKSQRNLTEAQQLAHIGNWELDLVNDTLEWSDEIYRIFEIDPDKFDPTYESFLNSIHPDDRERVNQAYTDSLKNKRPYDIAHRLLMKDGRIKYVHEFCKTNFDENGKPLRSIGLVQDISERKKIEDEQLKSAREWQQAMDSVEDAIYLIDLDDRVVRANKSFYQLTGLKPKQVIGENINRIMHPEGEPTPCPVCRARKAREDTILVMEKNHPDNPTGRPIEVILRVIRNAHEDPISILMRMRDLTRQREIENRLRQHQEQLEIEVEKRTAELTQVNRELESFSYSISHDLRAPLRAINGFAVAISEDYADKLDDTANDYLTRISAGANRMSVLIDDLLMLSHINRQELNKTSCNLSEMAESIREQFSEQSPHDNVEWKIQPQLGVNGDRNLIRIALENMFSNALKYSSRKSHIIIEFGCQQQGDKKVFYIRDNGAGFDMQYIDKLFGPFQRLHGREFEGTGIGLATVQRIINRHGGKVWAEAEVGKGATFYFSFD